MQGERVLEPYKAYRVWFLSRTPEIVKSRDSLGELLLTCLGGEAKRILDDEQVRCTCFGRGGAWDP